MPQWFLNCEVTRTGPTADKDKTLVQLSNRSGAFRDRWFTAAPSVRRELLATALTAISLGSRVEALVDDGAPAFGTLYTMYVAVRPLDRPLPAPPAVSDPRGYLAQVPRVVYRANDDHIHEFAIDPDSGRWGHFDMNAATGAPPAAGDPFGYFHDVPRVVYRANDGTIYELAIDPASGSWADFDMTTATRAPPAVGDPSGYSAGVPRVIYRARDGHIHELAIDPASGAWGRFDMTAATGAPPAAALDLAPFGYFHDVPRVVYWASDAHIHEFSIDPASGSWADFDMTTATGGPPTVGGPSGYSAGVPRVVYRANDGHIHEFSIDPASGTWRQFDLHDAVSEMPP